MILTREKKEEQQESRAARHKRILELAEGLTRVEIVAAMSDMNVREDTIFNDISQLKNEGKLRSEHGSPKFIYFRTSQHNPDDVLATCPIAMWGGYGAVKTTAPASEYHMDDFAHRQYPQKRFNAHVSGGSLELIV